MSESLCRHWMWSLFHCRKPDGCAVGSHRGFNFHSLITYYVEHTLVLLLEFCRSLPVSKSGFFVLPISRSS